MILGLIISVLEDTHLFLICLFIIQNYPSNHVFWDLQVPESIIWDDIKNQYPGNIANASDQ